MEILSLNNRHFTSDFLQKICPPRLKVASKPGLESSHSKIQEPCMMRAWATRASLEAQMVGICLQYRRPRFQPWVGKIPWRRKWLPTPVFLPGNQTSLAGYSSQDHKELNTTKQLTHTHMHDKIHVIFFQALLVYLFRKE